MRFIAPRFAHWQNTPIDRRHPRGEDHVLTASASPTAPLTPFREHIMLRLAALVMILSFAVSLSHAQQVYLTLPVAEIPFTEGDRAGLEGWWSPHQVWAAIDGPGEAYFRADHFRIDTGDRMPSELILTLPQAREVSGTLFMSARGEEASRPLKFVIPADRFTSDDDARQRFHQGKAIYYEQLHAQQLPGSAWFRHQADVAMQQVPPEQRPARNAPRNEWMVQSEEDRTLALFTGGRAVAENLALDRALPTPRDEDATVPLDSLRGITAPDFDFKPLLDDQAPEFDPLASLIPHDQHAIFFPSVAAFEATMAAVQLQLLPVMQWTEQGSDGRSVLEGYRLQLLNGVPMEQVREIAVTGSDPYFRTGTDIALLLHTDHPQQLADAIASAHTGIQGKVVGDAVVVTNSPAQLKRLQAVVAGYVAPLASLDEFRFFRQRYTRGGDETALLVISDATIRRWCGPKWRIASARRTRALAQLAERQALQMTEANPQPVIDEQWGTLAHLKPIVEMDFDKVTPAEAAAYNRWRDGYERGWRQAFDPIALQLKLSEGRVQTDLTVMPLIAGSEYQQMIDLAGEAKVGPRAGDPHENTLLHFVMAIDPKARQMEGWGQMARSMLQLEIDPWAWMDQSISLYMERDPVWQELAEAGANNEDAWGRHLNRLPVALHVDVKSAMRLVAFLAGVRTFIEQSAPGMVQFQARSHQEQGYVEVTVRDVGIDNVEPRLYYLATGKALVVSLSEDLIKRAIERHAQPDKHAGASPWLGEHAGLTVEGDALKWIARGSRDAMRELAQQQAWAALPILNEWRRLRPDDNPVQLHQRVWHQTLGQPDDYRWNEDWQTMESVAWGHPGQPRTPENPPTLDLLGSLQQGKLGVTFENQGLRAKADLSLQQ
jgi:hypothetical protein